jgi:hypothetical protein
MPKYNPNNATRDLSIIKARLAGTSSPGGSGLTDTELRATPVAVAPNISRNSGVVDANTQRVILATDQPALLVNIPDLIITGAAAQTAVVNNIIPSASGAAATDVSLYRSFAVQLVSTGTGGTFIFEGSNDNVNFQPILVYNQALLVRVPIVTAITATASQIIYEGSCNFRFIRLRIITTITGGSIQAHSVFIPEALGTASQVISNGTAANFLATVSGTVTANIGTGSIAAGTNAIGDMGVQYRANATGAASRTHVIAGATTNATIVKNAPGRLLGWNVSNTNAAFRYVKFHNQTTSPTAGSGVVQTIAVPPNSNVNFSIEGGIAFTTGIGMTTTTGAPDADNAAVGANDLVIDLFWA